MSIINPLTMLDRCDRCGAQAYVRATLLNGELLFCAHHGSEYAPVVEAQSLKFEDYTSTLREAENASAAR